MSQQYPESQEEYDYYNSGYIPDQEEIDRIQQEKKLINNPDAKVWAEEFVKMVKSRPTIATDEDTMIGWFANAIMAGYDHKNNISKNKIREVMARIITIDNEWKNIMNKELGID